MDASLRTQAEQLAVEMASQAKTVGDLNSLMRLMMKSAMERMLDTEMDVHLGRQGEGVLVEPAAVQAQPDQEKSQASHKFNKSGQRIPNRG